MFQLFGEDSGRLQRLAAPGPAEALSLDGVKWVDLLAPTQAEERALEAALGLPIPTREEMDEIEASSRLYHEDGALFMTASVLSRQQGGELLAMPVTFILSGGRLVTLRYHEPRSIALFLQRAEKGDLPCASGEAILIGLFEVIVDRLADIVEEAGQRLEELRAEIFRTHGRRPGRDGGLSRVLELIGKAEDVNGKIGASLATIERLVIAMTTLPELAGSKEHKARGKTLAGDVRSVADYVERQSQKITFLLEATLGMINIEQNGIIKIFSVMSVIFLPPTLIASVYGMNFEIMPELSLTRGYPIALGVMVMSAILPYLFFRKRGWL